MSNNKGLDKKRVVVAVLLLAWILAGLFFGGIILALFIGLFVFVGTKEFVQIAEARGMKPPFSFVVISNFLLIGLTSLKFYDLLFGALVLISLIAFLIILFRGVEAKVNDLAITLLGLVYTGVFPLHLLMIRDIETSTFTIMGQSFNIGIGLVLLVFIIVAATDIGAFYSGKLWGKNPLWKEISPKKTIEGSVGGTITAVAISLIIGYIIGLSILNSFIIGLLISIFAQLGDLAESMIKREAGIKDSGSLFPGHGGVLDRSDSYIFTVVAGYYYFYFFLVNDVTAFSSLGVL